MSNLRYCLMVFTLLTLGLVVLVGVVAWEPHLWAPGWQWRAALIPLTPAIIAMVFTWRTRPLSGTRITALPPQLGSNAALCAMWTVCVAVVLWRALGG